MTESTSRLTCTDLIATASQALSDGGYSRISGKFPEWDTPTSRLFEDEYSVVGIVAFDTCIELIKSWPDVQGTLVDVISGHIGRQESKSWDGYLVLLSPALAPSGDKEIEAIRSNTTRLRKLVATGDDLRSATNIERTLRPLLPFGQEQSDAALGSVLDFLPKLLAKSDINEGTTQLLVDAFREQSPLMERLHQVQDKQ
jgi:hypothetical protein